MTAAERGAVQTLFYRAGLCCWQKNDQREALFRRGSVSSSPPVAVGPRQVRFMKLAVMRNADLHIDSTGAENPPRSSTSADPCQCLCTCLCTLVDLLQTSACVSVGEELVSKQRDPHIMAPSGNRN